MSTVTIFFCMHTEQIISLSSDHLWGDLGGLNGVMTECGWGTPYPISHLNPLTWICLDVHQVFSRCMFKQTHCYIWDFFWDKGIYLQMAKFPCRYWYNVHMPFLQDVDWTWSEPPQTWCAVFGSMDLEFCNSMPGFSSISVNCHLWSHSNSVDPPDRCKRIFLFIFQLCGTCNFSRFGKPQTFHRCVHSTF